MSRYTAAKYPNDNPHKRNEQHINMDSTKVGSVNIVLLRDVFHIGLVIGPRPAVLAWGAAERQYSRPRTYN
jgi:hypothetical protein